MNILEIIVIAVAALLAVSGYRRGFIRKLASMAALVVSVVLVSFCLPYVTDFLKNNTPLYDFLTEQCRGLMEDQLAKAMGGDGGSGSVDAYRDMSLDEIRALMKENGYDSAVVDSLSDAQLEEERSQMIQQYAARYFSGMQTSADELDEDSQSRLIRSLPLPRIFRDQLLDNNNEAGYQKLGVSSFREYVVHFSATVILNVLSFVVALLLVQIVLRTVVAALDILSAIPVLGGLNRCLGLLLGLLQALLLLWIFFMAVSAASATEPGLYLLSMIQESRLLSWLYDSNFFMQVVLRTAAMFL